MLILEIAAGVALVSWVPIAFVIDIIDERREAARKTEILRLYRASGLWSADADPRL